MPDPLTGIGTRSTSQRTQADPRQVKNNEGGFTFKVGDLARLHRFLTIGTDGGTYYVREQEITKQNADIVLQWARERPADLVREVVAISTAGRAPRQNPAIFALAAAAASDDVVGRRAALDALPAVCRTGTHLFLFARYVEQFRGWGRSLKRGVGEWYLNKSVDDLAYQVTKYRQREGWSHRDLLRLSHPVTTDLSRKALFNWISGRETTEAPNLVTAFDSLQRAQNLDHVLALVNTVDGITHEMIPDQWVNERAVWEAMLEHDRVPITALIRQLPRLSRLGILDRNADTLPVVTQRLMSVDRLRKGRVHPINVLIAMRTYAQGHGERGKLTWTPSTPVIDALDDAFYRAYGAIVPANKRTLLALDVSGSMGFPLSGLPITAREATAALALVTAATEPRHEIVGFTASGGGVYWGGASAITPLSISPRQRLTDAVAQVNRMDFGATDCALPMQWALQNKIGFDTIVVLTDNETWYGTEHPHQALRRYREQINSDARLVVVAMTATDFTIADPADPGSLDVAGFDSAVPNLIRNFSAGDL